VKPADHSFAVSAAAMEWFAGKRLIANRQVRSMVSVIEGANEIHLPGPG